MDIQFMKDYYDLRYEETDGENHFVEETAYQEKQSEHSKMEDQLMEMVGGTESNVWKLYESIMCVYFDMEEIIKQAVYLQGAISGGYGPGAVGGSSLRRSLSAVSAGQDRRGERRV